MYFSSFLVLNDNPPPYTFAMPIATDEYDSEDPTDQGLYVLLKFTLTPKYPEEAPLIEFEESDNFDGEIEEELRAHLNEQVEEAGSKLIDNHTNFEMAQNRNFHLIME